MSLLLYITLIVFVLLYHETKCTIVLYMYCIRWLPILICLRLFLENLWEQWIWEKYEERQYEARNMFVKLLVFVLPLTHLSRNSDLLCARCSPPLKGGERRRKEVKNFFLRGIIRAKLSLKAINNFCCL